MTHFERVSNCGARTLKMNLARAAVFSVLLFAFFFAAGGVPPAGAQTAGDSLYAVLFNGDPNGSDATYLNDLEFIFNTLIDDFAYTKENIIVLSFSGNYYDFDGDNVSDIDYSGTRANIETVFATLKGIVTDGDVVLFYGTDHGSTLYGDCSHAALDVYGGGNRIFDTNIAAYFDSLDTADREITKIFVFGECYSGGMIPELAALDYPVMVTTATKACDEKSNSWDDPGCPDTLVSCDHCAYLFHWTAAFHTFLPDDTTATKADSNGDGYVSIWEGAKHAMAKDEFAQATSSPKETPQYWDTDCLVGRRMTLNGEISSLPGMIAFVFKCHDAPPCRWRSWRCGAGGPFPSGSVGGPEGDGTVEATVWSDAEPAPGETTLVWARVRNQGDTPLTSAEVNFYFSDPGLSLIYPQTGLTWFATQTVPFLPPQAVLTVGPVVFVAPPEGNSFGEPYWTLMATAEHYQSPVESGWLAEDDHVAAANAFVLRGVPGEPKTIHLVARNALSVPVKALLSIDDDGLPAGWSVSMNPAAGDTIELDADSWTPVELVLTGTSGAIREGFVDVSMALNTTTVKECESCDDSICGGYIGEAGGCSVKLEVEGNVGIAAPKLTVASGATAITLSWESSGAGDIAGFNVYRSEKQTGDYLRLNDALIAGSGELRYVDKTAMPGKAYLYAVGVVYGDSETLGAPVEASLASTPEFGMSQNYPNPFNPSTTIQVIVSEEGPISVRVYDTAGHLVRTLFAGMKTRGVHYLYWSGDTDTGERVSSGVYYCRIESAKEGARTRKLVVIR